jgi:hypothetical protein
MDVGGNKGLIHRGDFIAYERGEQVREMSGALPKAQTHL